MHEFFSFNFPWREYLFCTSSPPHPISLLLVLSPVSVKRGLTISVSWNTGMRFRKLRGAVSTKPDIFETAFFFRPHETSESAHRNRNHIFLKPLSGVVWGPASTRIRETKYAILNCPHSVHRAWQLLIFCQLNAKGKNQRNVLSDSTLREYTWF